MTHTIEHSVVHKIKTFLTAPLPGGGKIWHVVTLCAIFWAIGKFV